MFITQFQFFSLRHQFFRSYAWLGRVSQMQSFRSHWGTGLYTGQKPFPSLNLQLWRFIWHSTGQGNANAEKISITNFTHWGVNISTSRGRNKWLTETVRPCNSSSTLPQSRRHSMSDVKYPGITARVTSNIPASQHEWGQINMHFQTMWSCA